MKISHDDYLKCILESKKLQLRERKVAYRVSTAKYEMITEILEDDIKSLEQQLKV